MSDAARNEILRQLGEGKLTAEQAAELLRALGNNDSSGGGSSDNDQYDLAAKQREREEAKKRQRKLIIKLNGRAIKNGPHTFTLPLGFLTTIRSFTDMIPAVRNLIMWDAMNLVGGELADVTISIE